MRILAGTTNPQISILNGFEQETQPLTESFPGSPRIQRKLHVKFPQKQPVLELQGSRDDSRVPAQLQGFQTVIGLLYYSLVLWQTACESLVSYRALTPLLVRPHDRPSIYPTRS